MYDCYITFRSITRAQQAMRALGSVNIGARLMRAPKSISAMGCGYAILVREEELDFAVAMLRSQNAPFERVLRYGGNGRLEAMQP